FPESLLESELFGYTEGSFTGASRGGKIGLFEAAHTGTIFLDEIGEMPLSLQTRLLRVLQEKEVLRIGAIDPTPIDVRVIAATHQDLAALVEQGLFRRDLYYRLNILLIRLSPLRERSEDLRPLVGALQRKWISQHDGRRPLDEGVVEALLAAARHYDWPGNVRELENVLERIMVLSDLYPLNEATDEALKALVPEVFGHSDAGAAGAAGVGASAVVAQSAAAQGPEAPGAALGEHSRAAQLRHIRQVLQECGGNQAKAAEVLNISRTTLWRRLKQGA